MLVQNTPHPFQTFNHMLIYLFQWFLRMRRRPSFLTGLEFYYYSKFQTFFNSEFIVIFHGDYFGSLAYKNNPYFPTGDHIISVSGGLIEGMVSVKVGTSVPDDFNIKQALLTLSLL